MIRRLSGEIGYAIEALPPVALPRGFAWCPGCGPVAHETALAAAGQNRPLALILVYRSAVLGGDTRPVADLISGPR